MTDVFGPGFDSLQLHHKPIRFAKHESNAANLIGFFIIGSFSSC
jgi:hypothetical protein